MEEVAKNVHDWLVKRVRDLEEKDPKLKQLKDEVNEISSRIRSAKEKDVPGLLAEQTDAINRLVNHVS